MVRLAAALGCFLVAGAAAADERLTGVAKDGRFYRLDKETVCKPLAVSPDGTAKGYAECQLIAKRGQAGMNFEKPKHAGLPDGRRLATKLVEPRPGDVSPAAKTPQEDPFTGKPMKPRDDRLAVVLVAKDGTEEVLAYWAGHPEVVAAEDVFLSRDGRTAVVVYDAASEILARVSASAVGFRLAKALSETR